jgi:aspartate-semialdehyde dehydrogenase
MTVALKALQDAFTCGAAVSLQALSGAGYPGVASLDILDIIPYISNEEEKVEEEPRKMLGALRDGQIEPAGFSISAQTNRVAVSDGHLVCLSVELERPQGVKTAPPPCVNTWRQKAAACGPRLSRHPAEGRSLTARSRVWIVWKEKAWLPSFGRLRPDPLPLKMVVLSHNTIALASAVDLQRRAVGPTGGYRGLRPV